MANRSKRIFQLLAKKAVKFDKLKIVRLISSKTNVKTDIVLSILNIMIDEIHRDLKDGKKVKIDNFGIFDLFQPKPRKILNIGTKKHEVVESKLRLRFTLDKGLVFFISKFME